MATNEDTRVRVYVAAASSQIDRARGVSDQLRVAGFIVTSTWIDEVDKFGPNPRDVSTEQREAWSDTDLNQVRDADVFWFLVPPEGRPTRGAWTELGVAIECNRVCVASGDTKQSIFGAKAWEFGADQDALAWLITEQSAIDVPALRAFTSPLEFMQASRILELEAQVAQYERALAFAADEAADEDVDEDADDDTDDE